MQTLLRLVTLLACTATAAAQTVRYSTGFEPPQFQLGPFAGTTFSNGQDGWLATGDSSNSPNLQKFVVQAATVDAGARAISIDATGQPTPYAHIRRNTQFLIPASEPVLEIAFDMRLGQPVSSASEWSLQAQAGPGPGSGMLEWWISTGGELHVTSASGDVPTGVLLQRERWYRMTTRVNTATQTTSVYVDGALAASVAALSGATWGFHAFTSLVFSNPGDDRLYVDDFSIATHSGALVTSYCTSGTTTHGCSAVMSASGSPSASASSGFVLSASGVEGAVNGTIFYGITGRVAWPWGPGSTSWLCVKAPQQRTLVASSGGAGASCAGVLSIDFLDWAHTHPSALGAPLAAGATFNAQAWFRDAGAVKNTSTSNGIEFTLLP